MTEGEAIALHAQLAEEIRRHDKAYYNEGHQTISDQQYDELSHRLIEIEKAFPKLATKDSPTQRVGGEPLAQFEKIQHGEPMLSLDNILAKEGAKKVIDFVRFVQKQLPAETLEWVIEPKVDGVAVNLRYENGIFTVGATRGNGQEGDDITTNLRTVRNIPLALNKEAGAIPTTIEVRGEMFLPVSEFNALNDKLNLEGKETFLNPRNAAAGSLKQLDPRIAKERRLQFIAYGVGRTDMDPSLSPKTQTELLSWLKRLGFKTSEWVKTCRSHEELMSGIGELDKVRQAFKYQTDGAVIKLNHFEQRRRVGSTAKAPSWARAYKFQPEQEETQILGITVQVGRTGTLTPVAELKTVLLAGSNISRATLHNEDEIRRKDIRIGDTVVIEKSGDVIPAVVEVVLTKRPSNTQPFDFLAFLEGKCPKCGAPISRQKGFVAWKCENIACPAQSTRRLAFFAQRRALDIESLGETIADKFIEKGIVKEPLDLFALKLSDLANLNLGSAEEPRTLGEKNAKKILEGVAHAKTLPLSRWLLGLAIPHVGETTAHQIAKFHKNLKELKDSSVLKDVLKICETARKAQDASPDATKNMPPNRRARIDKQKELESTRKALAENVPSSQAGEIRDKLGSLATEIKRLENLEPAEREERIKEQKLLNEQIETIATRLKNAGVDVNLVKTEKKEKTNTSLKKGPPSIDVTTEISPEAARSILNFFDSPGGIRTLERIDKIGVSHAVSGLKPTGDASEQPLKNKVFVLTGTLQLMKRDQAADEIRRLGGIVTNSVSKKTDFLIVGENAGSTKSDQAQAAGVKEITESEFLEMIGSNEKQLSSNQSQLL